MRQHLTTIVIPTAGRGLVDISARVQEEVAASRIATGLANLFLRHTSASLLVQENADPAVRTALTAVNLAIPVQGGRLALGTWQGIYLWEHRRQGHRRELMLHVLGEP